MVPNLGLRSPADFHKPITPDQRRYCQTRIPVSFTHPHEDRVCLCDHLGNREMSPRARSRNHTGASQVWRSAKTHQGLGKLSADVEEMAFFDGAGLPLPPTFCCYRPVW